MSESFIPNAPIELVVSLIIGVVLCFAGYRLKRIAFSVIWFVIGYTIAKAIAPNLIDDQFWLNIIPLAAGIVLAVFGLSIEKLAVSIAAFAIVALLVIQHFGPVTSWVLPAIAVAAGSVASMIAVAAMKPAVIIFTGIEGANLLATGIVGLLPESITAIPYLSLILLVILAVVGITSQFRSTKNME